MGFYEEFIEKYDSLISWENRLKREHSFFDTLFQKYNVKSVLDCACGTGQHVIMLSQKGISAKGSDLSPAMIKKAKINAKEHGVSVTFKISDFRNLSKVFNEKFDALICIGNSLPHLLKNSDLKKALCEMNKVLKHNGLLILQQRNYDMLTSLKKRFFPMSIRDNEVFFYVLDYLKDKIIFNIIYLELKTKKFEIFKTEYNPLKKEKLVKFLEEIGFIDFKFYRDYDFNKFDLRKGDDLIVICRKE